MKFYGRYLHFLDLAESKKVGCSTSFLDSLSVLSLVWHFRFFRGFNPNSMKGNFSGQSYIFQVLKLWQNNTYQVVCVIKHILKKYRISSMHASSWSVKFLYTSLYTWFDLIICFDSELFPQNFVWQLNNDQKSLNLYYECLK